MWDRLSARIRLIFGREDDPPRFGLGAKSGNADLRTLKVEHSVASSEAKVAQNHLRVMNVEREILSHAIRRLYEAEADGKINKSELKALLNRYKERMVMLKNTIQHDQSLLTLYKLECIQHDLLGLFNKHFDDLNKKIGELKARLGVESTSILPSKGRKGKRKKRRKRKKRSSPTEKSEVEERIKKIRAEVDKTLEKLGRLEAKA